MSWRKPATFGVSFGLTLVTISWVSSYLTLRPRTRSWLLGILTADCILEVAGITVQAWRRVPSHFNTETPLNLLIAMNLASVAPCLSPYSAHSPLTAFRGRLRATPSLQLVRVGDDCSARDNGC